MKRNSINTRKGFTLVEMLGVLAIIAILISVISVGVLSAINRARIVATVSNFKNLETAMLAYVALPESQGQVPLTKSNLGILTVNNLALNANNGANLAANNGQMDLHLESVFLAAGTLERYPTWRAGRDAMQSGVIMANERGWNRKKNKWSMWKADGTGALAAPINDWRLYARAECAIVVPTLTPGASTTVQTNGMMAASGVNFKLDGTTNLPNATRCAYVVLAGLSLKDAEKLSEEINGSLNTMDLKASPSPVIIQTAGRFVTDGVDRAVDGTVYGFYYLANL
jgi:prepilin-type N-terminal cleavage/methylation domain-containing protein